MPLDNDRFLSKAKGLKLDSLTLDLEDGVSEAKKAVARHRLQELFRDASPAEAFPNTREVLVRINGVDSPHFEEDLHALARIPQQLRPHGILLPKTESPLHLRKLNQWIDEAYAEEDAHIPAILLAIETAKGMVDLRDIMRADFGRTQALIFASEDYCADLGLSRSPEGLEMLWARSRIVAHARAFKLQAIDMVCIDYQNQSQLIRECHDGVRMGFDGKQAIHPAQIEVIMENFMANPRTIEFAKNIIAQNEIHSGKPFVLDGIVVDKPVVHWAQMILNSIQQEKTTN